METTTLRTDISLLKESVLKLHTDFEALHQGCVKHDEYVDKELNNHQFRLNCQRDDINKGQEKFRDLNERHDSLAVDSLLTTARFDSMSDHLCHCGTGDQTQALECLIPSPALSYEGSNTSYHTPPQLGAPTRLPLRKESTTNDSNAENVPPRPRWSEIPEDARLIPVTEDIQVYEVPQEG